MTEKCPEITKFLNGLSITANLPTEYSFTIYRHGALCIRCEESEITAVTQGFQNDKHMYVLLELCLHKVQALWRDTSRNKLLKNYTDSTCQLIEAYGAETSARK